MLSACVPSVSTPKDEIRLYSWDAEFENEKSASLTFDDTNAYLNVTCEAFDLNIGGLCVLTDGSLSICDDATLASYTFSYVLYGDRVELSFDGGTISLFKDNSS